MNLKTIQSQFKSLRMPEAAKSLEDVLAKYKTGTSLNWLSELLQLEIDARKESTLQRRIKNGGFSEIKTLESFDWDFNPKLPKEKVMQLSTLDFIENKEIALFLGYTGTGKTHIAMALGLNAIKQGKRVLCTSSKKLAQQIRVHKQKQSLDKLFKKFLSSDLWIIDDWGMISMEKDISEEVFDLLDRRKHTSAMILTSNRSIREWAEVFSDPVLANAATDRIFEGAHILPFEGKSYRLQGKLKATEFDIMAHSD